MAKEVLSKLLSKAVNRNLLYIFVLQNKNTSFGLSRLPAKQSLWSQFGENNNRILGITTYI
jgi:hypothetical protein